jgi:hypothetical protein
VIETRLTDLEGQVTECETLFASPDHNRDGARAVSTLERYRSLKEEVRVLTEEWEALTVTVDRLGQEMASLSQAD